MNRSTRSLTTKASPEEEELRRKQAELEALQDLIAEKELDLLALEQAQQAFEAEYLNIVGRAFADLDSLVAQIAQLLAARHPSDRTTKTRADAASQQSERSTGAVADAEPCAVEPEPTPDLKRLYREVAKRVHPDLADSDQDRAEREELMKAANAAYERGDVDALRHILENWEVRPDALKGIGIAEQLIRVIRKIAQLKARLTVIEAAIERITQSNMYRLRSQVALMGRTCEDVFGEMAAGIRERMLEIERTLASIVEAHRREQEYE